MENVKNEKVKELTNKIEATIVESGLNYREVTQVLKGLNVTYMDKGNNLLNATNIQKVIDTPRFIR